MWIVGIGTGRGKGTFGGNRTVLYLIVTMVIWLQEFEKIVKLKLEHFNMCELCIKNKFDF